MVHGRRGGPCLPCGDLTRASARSLGNIRSRESEGFTSPCQGRRLNWYADYHGSPLPIVCSIRLSADHSAKVRRGSVEAVPEAVTLWGIGMAAVLAAGAVRVRRGQCLVSGTRESLAIMAPPASIAAGQRLARLPGSNS